MAVFALIIGSAEPPMRSVELPYEFVLVCIQVAMESVKPSEVSDSGCGTESVSEASPEASQSSGVLRVFAELAFN